MFTFLKTLFRPAPAICETLPDCIVEMEARASEALVAADKIQARIEKLQGSIAVLKAEQRWCEAEAQRRTMLANNFHAMLPGR